MKSENLNQMRLYIAASSGFVEGLGHLSSYGLVIEIQGKCYEHWGKLKAGGDVTLPKVHALLRVLDQLNDLENSANIDIGVLIKGVDLKLRLDAKATKIRTAKGTKKQIDIADDDPEVRTSILWDMVPRRPMRNAETKDEKLLLRRATKIAQSKRYELIAFVEEGNVLEHGVVIEDPARIKFPPDAPVQEN